MLSTFVPRDEYHIRGTGKLSRDLLAFCSLSGLASRALAPKCNPRLSMAKRKIALKSGMLRE